MRTKQYTVTFYGVTDEIAKIWRASPGLDGSLKVYCDTEAAAHDIVLRYMASLRRCLTGLTLLNVKVERVELVAQGVVFSDKPNYSNIKTG